ncbi:MAG: hypothetical protein M3Y37_10405 [Chloroflexota bacterium]|nr:hypothetical protein [Chloroflexota bacterium]
MLLPGSAQNLEIRLQQLVGRPLGSGTIVGRVKNGTFWFAVQHTGPEGQVVLPRVVEGRLAERSPGSVALVIREALSWPGLALFAFGTLVTVSFALLFALEFAGVPTHAFDHRLVGWILGSTAFVVLLAVGWELSDLVRGKNCGLREMVLAQLGSQAEPEVFRELPRTSTDW